MTQEILIRTESVTELHELCTLLEQEIRPHSVLEKIYVADIVGVTWEMKRLNRAKAELVKATFPEAVASLIKKLSPNANLSRTLLGAPPDLPRQEIALDWISDSGARKKVADFLKRFDLDERSIEAEAVILCMPTLDKLEQMLSLLERRRARAIWNLCWHRENFADAQKDLKRVSGASGGNVRRLERLPRVG